MKASTRDVLDYLLEGNELTPDELDDFKERFDEDQYLDYKDGHITSRGEADKKGKQTIREYVSAFANSDGGILVVGVTDKRPRKISGCLHSGRESLDRWAESLLVDMAPMLSPLPRIHVVQHPAGEVLVIAVARAPELVPYVESRQLKYFLRFNQSTIEAPPYLVSDLILGRRRRPLVDLHVRVGQPSPFGAHPERQVFFYLSAQNVGLVAAEQIEIGLVSWVVGGSERINDALLTYLDFGAKPEVGGASWGLRHGITHPKVPSVTVLAPFAQMEFDPIEGFVYLFPEQTLNVVATLYLLSQGSPPQWFELRFTCEREPGKERIPRVGESSVVKVVGRRARVLLSP